MARRGACVNHWCMSRFCALSQAIVNDEECSRACCAFWEHGGASVEPGCAVERLGFDLENIDLVHYLLDLRRALD